MTWQQSRATHIDVSLSQQTLTVCRAEQENLVYSVATALQGAGCLKNSFCTPTGRHIVRAKIGAGLPLNAVLLARRPTGEVYTPELAARYPQRDWILTRILWLSGTEIGHNRLGDVDTMQRYIYIHGTPDSVSMGIPSSHGCIRMRNQDVLALFDCVTIGVTVDIQ